MVQHPRQIALVADDHELYRTGLARLLRQELRFEAVIEVASFTEALSRLAGAAPLSLATFDLAMSGMDGPASLELVRRIRPDLPVAVVTGTGTGEDVLRVLAAGAQGFAPKTLAAVDLARGLESMLRGQLFVHPGLLASASNHSSRAELPEPPLTPRQRQVVRLIAEGKSNKEIARALRLAEGTIKVHVNALYRTLSVRNRAGAVAALAQQSWRRPLEVLSAKLLMLATIMPELV